MPDQNSRSIAWPSASVHSATTAWGGQRNISRVGRDRGIPPAIEKKMMAVNQAFHGWPSFFHSDVGRGVWPPLAEGYSHLPADQQRQVIVVGAGIGGLITALELAKLGYQVDVYEASDYLGGRLGAKPLAASPSGVWEHGLHHFFVNVYDFLMQKMEEIGADQHLEVVDSVYLHFETYQNETLQSKPNTHFLNLIGILWRSPNVTLLDSIKSMRGMLPVFFYNHQQVIAKYDQLTMAEYSKKTGISPAFDDTFIKTILTVSINRMSSISAAQVLQLMWVFFLCRPDAMNRLVPTDNHYNAVFQPFAEHLQKMGVNIHLQRPIHSLELAAGKISGVRLADDSIVPSDYVVLATDVKGTQAILQQTTHPELLPQLQPVIDRVGRITIAAPYIVARAYFLAQPHNPDLPDVVETPENQPVDLVFQPHKTEKQEAEWVQNAPPGETRWILEVHGYDLGPTLFEKYGQLASGAKPTDDQLWELIQSLADEQIWAVLQQSLSTIDGLENMATAQLYPVGGLQLRRYYNFTGFQVGQADRPPSFLADQQFANLFLVGDWVAVQGRNDQGQPGVVHPGGNLLGQVASVAGIAAGLIAAQDRVVGPAVAVI
jgi:carotenoid phi-ring synthase / carotenoid chi-ring synthase